LLLDHLLYAINFYAWIFFGIDDDKNETIGGNILWVTATLQKKKKIRMKTSKADSVTFP